jgi:2-dehydro-3-deoxy-D-arabinonate dehydratase
LGPCVLIISDPLPKTTAIRIAIARGGAAVFEGATTLARVKRELPELVGYLYRDHTFRTGAFLLTGTGIVPPDSFTLRVGDEVSITIDGIGTLTNVVGT